MDLFRKLGVGAKFDYKRFHKDAERLKLVEPTETSKDVRSALDYFGDLQKDKVTSAAPINMEKITTLTLESKAEDSSDMSEDDEAQSSSGDSTSATHDSGSQSDEELQLLGNIRSKGEGEVTKLKRQRRRKEKTKSAAKLKALKNEEINHIRKKNRIHVYGCDVPDPLSSLHQLSSEYGLHSQVVTNLQNVGYETLTPIQMQAIPVMMQRREVMACAPTGSGKTAAFILPLLHCLKEPRNLGFRAVILAPTRELAKQTCRWFQRLSDGRGFRTHYIEKASTAAKKFGPKSSQKFDILVATPNRLVFLLQHDPPLIKLDNVEWLVVDESDKLFEEGKRGFRDQLAVIYRACDNRNIRRALFSATFAHDVEQWCKLNLDNVIQVYVGARNVATETVKQELVFVGNESGKLLAVREIFRKGVEPPVLIFVQSKDRAKELFSELIYDGINVDLIHADRTQVQRDNVVKCFRSGKIWVLLCTELMGRGIDFQGVNLVINYDFPNSAVSYIHRIGRTGRAGRDGKAVTFFTEGDGVNLRSIANVMREAGCPVPEYMLTIKRPSRKERKKMAGMNPRRPTISTLPEDVEKAKQKRKLLKRRRKQHKRDDNTKDIAETVDKKLRFRTSEIPSSKRLKMSKETKTEIKLKKKTISKEK